MIYSIVKSAKAEAKANGVAVGRKGVEVIFGGGFLIIVEAPKLGRQEKHERKAVREWDKAAKAGDENAKGFAENMRKTWSDRDVLAWLNRKSHREELDADLYPVEGRFRLGYLLKLLASVESAYGRGQLETVGENTFLTTPAKPAFKIILPSSPRSS